jgi:hypothetical protein
MIVAGVGFRMLGLLRVGTWREYPPLSQGESTSTVTQRRSASGRRRRRSHCSCALRSPARTSQFGARHPAGRAPQHVQGQFRLTRARSRPAAITDGDVSSRSAHFKGGPEAEFRHSVVRRVRAGVVAASSLATEKPLSGAFRLGREGFEPSTLGLRVARKASVGFGLSGFFASSSVLVQLPSGSGFGPHRCLCLPPCCPGGAVASTGAAPPRTSFLRRVLVVVLELQND